MTRLFSSFYARISTIFLLLVLALGGGIVVIAFSAAGILFGDVEQLLNRDYARSIARELAPASRRASTGSGSWTPSSP